MFSTIVMTRMSIGQALLAKLGPKGIMDPAKRDTRFKWMSANAYAWSITSSRRYLCGRTHSTRLAE